VLGLDSARLICATLLTLLIGLALDANVQLLDGARPELNARRPGIGVERIKVAIIGGGCAGIAAAFELSRPEHKRKFDITIYQLGWRLGGKGASGRGPHGRIEEHGFHVWMGCYENAFRLMRECYQELGRDPRSCRIADWRDAFFPAPFLTVAAPRQDGSYSTLVSYFPPAEGLPGDPITDNNPFTVSSYLAHAANALRTMLLTVETRLAQSAERQSYIYRPTEQRGDSLLSLLPQELTVRISRLLKLGLLATTAGMLEALGLLQALFERSSIYPSVFIPTLETIASTIRRQLEAFINQDWEFLILWQAIDLELSSMIGIIRFGLFADPRGFDAINDYDFREWIRLNGASESTVNSPLVRASYDLAMAYEDGNFSQARHAAGVALRGSLRFLFTYRGSIVWKMRAGMGDVVFAPFYEVLRRRGVSFRFFHRLEAVRMAEPQGLKPGERGYVKALEFAIQAEVRNNEYQPLIDIDGLPCWPSAPDFPQLVNGDGLRDHRFESHWDKRCVSRKTLRVCEDFDFVVLAVGLGAIPHVCQELVERDKRWHDMVTNIRTVETQAFQLWLNEDMEALGWDGPAVSMCGFERPFDTWGDMRHLIDEERSPIRPKAIAYFCSALSEPDQQALDEPEYDLKRREQVRRDAIAFLNQHIRQLWPLAVTRSGRFRWELLLSQTRDAEVEGEDRFNTQFYTANVNPTDRYVLSTPGTQKFRISPLDNTYDNLTIAGDWTACGLDTGCVESAMISGRLAAHAISGYPALRDIIGYDHP
jgi:uncharacterized protein with NAD-binding domain and iron-sulfur cluster